MCFEEVSESYDSTMRAYRDIKKRASAPVTDGDMVEIMRWAGNHIGQFLTWIIRRGFQGDTHCAGSAELERVRNGQLLGIDLLLRYYGGRFCPDDVCPEILPFVEVYVPDYELYWKDYENWLVDGLGELPFECATDWEDYLRFEPVLDRAYEVFRADPAMNRWRAVRWFKPRLPYPEQVWAELSED